MKKHILYLGLGTNVGDRRANLEKALNHLEEAGVHVLKKSRIFETQPVGYTDQDWFLNQAVKAETVLIPEDLMQTLVRIEKKTGRKKTFQWGPRVIDIDILFYDDRVIHKENLVIPHARYRDRRFVLEPLNDLDPSPCDPETGETMADLLNRCDDTAIVRPLF